MGYSDNGYYKQGQAAESYVYELSDAHPAPTVSSAAATAKFNAGDIIANNWVQINDIRYTFKSSVANDYEVKFNGDDVTDSITNLINAINMQNSPGQGSNAAGQKYMVPAAHPDVTASVGQYGSLLVTAKVAGTAGNAYSLTADAELEQVSDFVTENTGVDGTVGKAGEVRYDSNSIIYLNTAAGVNWVVGIVGGP